MLKTSSVQPRLDQLGKLLSGEASLLDDGVQRPSRDRLAKMHRNAEGPGDRWPGTW